MGGCLQKDTKHLMQTNLAALIRQINFDNVQKSLETY